MIKRPKTAEAYVTLIDQALYEIEDLRMAAEYDMDSMGPMPFLESLEAMVRDLRQSMRDGSYRFANEDLPFMNIVAKTADNKLPFKFLLQMINETHRKGLNVEED